ncbi:hypothetical protein Pmani_028111 [Petrolisthes manimaculis]|uniref:Cryptochrome-1 n=1 Tax=Petrolisthes manimaculis TaxID=1843537 RepID=A0AAE1P1P4_9EUCA|nr:hypothetical protein Pmani_028111 [Petrolisthes manimaculis]
MSKVSVHWFRHGLRFHDNPALFEAINDAERFYAVFIIDGESAGTKTSGYNRAQFLYESLCDLDSELKAVGSQLFIFNGVPAEIFTTLHREAGVTHLSFEQDCEAIWNQRDDDVRRTCLELGMEVIEKISHTLWDPFDIIDANGGQPPLTYEMFVQVAQVLGDPPRALPNPEWDDVIFGEITDELATKLKLAPQVPTPEMQGWTQNGEAPVYVGGERRALQHLKSRLRVEEDAFRDGYILPNQVNPDFLGPPLSMSAALRFGCLSVRKFYWDVHETYNKVNRGQSSATHSLTAQLIWREFFYCMSANNPKYDQMKQNPICIQIPWYKNPDHLKAWEMGQTGYPFIDACMRQMRKEGWIHHVGRTAVACFLTRGDLWISWEEGLKVFYKYLIDADWSVAAGNWMWVSSSAFERQLDCSVCVCPVAYGKRLEPTGEYIRRYVPELASLPHDYIFEPWKAPSKVQEKFGCIVGKDYPKRIVRHKTASKANYKMMKNIRDSLKLAPKHCAPSNADEIRQYLRLPKACFHNIVEGKY